MFKKYIAFLNCYAVELNMEIREKEINRICKKQKLIIAIFILLVILIGITNKFQSLIKVLIVFSLIEAFLNYSIYNDYNKRNSEFISQIPILLNIIVLLINCGYSLEKSLGIAFKQIDESGKLLGMTSFVARFNSPYDGLLEYAETVSNDYIWGFVNILNLYKITGSLSSVKAMEGYLKKINAIRLDNALKESKNMSMILMIIMMGSFGSVMLIVIAPIIINLS